MEEPPHPTSQSPPPAEPPSGGYLSMSSSTVRPRGGRTACGPCSRRKIRCDAYERNPQPCTNCTKRGQPDGCTFNDDAPRSGTRRSRASEGARSPGAPRPKKPRPSETAQNVLDGIHAAGVAYTSAPSNGPTSSWGAAINAGPPTGTYATKSYNVVPGPQHQPPWQPPPAQIHSQYYSSESAPPAPTGLNVTYSSSAQPIYSGSTEIKDLLPPQKTVLRYFEVYKTICHPIYPVISDLEEFEAGVCQYVEDMNSGRLTYELGSSSGRSKAARLAWLSLLTATVATGWQYSDASAPERDNFVNVHTRNAQELLRHAEYLGRPDENCITALLLIARIMENDLMPEAAWTTLGMVGRMADLTGLQEAMTFDEHHDARAREAIHIRHHKLWWSYLWQEYSLALCFGKTSVVRVNNDEPPVRVTSSLTYNDCMLLLCKLAISARPSPSMERSSLKSEIDALATARHLHEQALPRLADRANCRTIQDRIEYYSLRISQGFVVSCMSQTLMKACARLGWDQQSKHLQSMCKEGAFDCLQAWVDMQSFSIVPLRTWIFIFSALSSALVLAALSEDVDRAKIQDLQTRLLQSLAERDRENELPHRPGLYVRYPKALSLLRDVNHHSDAKLNGSSKHEEGGPPSGAGTFVLTDQQARDLLDPPTMWNLLFSLRSAGENYPVQHTTFAR
ncbi:uncharacterized protein HMPREF1541_05449 [Cyphellophora europaea CBS 101466]|uniref:Zn(2)-C6 fungal-type domain-containing protein n=1 Tax=Cyphellophora europaea (strain CBS 101466) TaxID=1220924 RepID=W2RRS3_CYPE1|nr:uncharacterized protein HMPREF1541_05449 [Cyphellophora europaea CBS 101466]ETN39226.1 hypothetical protein HMPREF1541_05449 [Cyphellophora europaea CBS 101466]